MHLLEIVRMYVVNITCEGDKDVEFLRISANVKVNP